MKARCYWFWRQSKSWVYWDLGLAWGWCKAKIRRLAPSDFCKSEVENLTILSMIWGQSAHPVPPWTWCLWNVHGWPSSAVDNTLKRLFLANNLSSLICITHVHFYLRRVTPVLFYINKDIWISTLRISTEHSNLLGKFWRSVAQSLNCQNTEASVHT